MLALGVVVLTTGLFSLVEAQTLERSQRWDPDWQPPRTAWGHPDLQGNWSNVTLTPFERGRSVGRDHNPGAMTAWMAGAGIRGGQVIGSTDEFGYRAMEQPISAHDLHATMLHLLGMDHTKLTYRFSGRDMRLTDVHGTLIPQIIT